MNEHDTTAALTSMTARTQSMTLDPMRVNPVRGLVAGVRALADDLTPAQLAMRNADRAMVDRLRATGLYSLSPRTR